MSRSDGILHLVLNAHPWEEIEAGHKPVEYRSLSWLDKILSIPVDGPVCRRSAYTSVRLQRGFHKIDGRVPTLLFRIDNIDVGPADPRWTYGIVPEGEQFVRIWLGERIA